MIVLRGSIDELILDGKVQQREMPADFKIDVAGQMVPLSTTMAERIKEIKRWADTRAVKAS